MQFRQLFTALLIALAVLLLSACGREAAPVQDVAKKIGVLLVAHGSKSSAWTGEIDAFATGVREALLKQGGVQSVRLAYVRESSPTIAQEMKAFDTEGYAEVVIVPLLIATESTITNSYLQYLAGMRSEAKAIKQLQNEGFEIYYPKARVTMTPALSDSEVLKKSVLRRVNALKGADSGEDMAVLLVGYGDQVYGQQMEELMESLGRYLKVKTDIDTVAFAFCGKLTDYSGTPVVESIKETLELEQEVLVVPVLLATDDMLQVNTIQAAINAIPTASKVRYKADAVLPDLEVNEWIVQKVGEAVERSRNAGGATVPAPNRG